MKLTKKIIKSEVFKKIACYLCYLYIRFVLLTSKVTYIFHGFDFSEYEETQAIYATWHGRVLIMPITNPTKLKSCAIVSDHNDGRLIGEVLRHSNIEVIYGSSNKKRITSLKEIFIGIRKGLNFLITPDGPRGPARKVDGAIINIASTSNLPIIPASCSFSRKKIFNSWDNFMLPFPFNRIILTFGKPIRVPQSLSVDKRPEYEEILENSLNELTEIADAKVFLNHV